MSRASRSTGRSDFDGIVGLRPVHGQAGESLLELDVEARHLNRRGIVHGGVICTLLDDAIGLAVHSLLQPDGQASTADLTVHFIRPANPGRLRAEGRVLRQGRRLVVGEGRVYDSDGNLVAHGVGTWAVVKPPSTG